MGVKTGKRLSVSTPAKVRPHNPPVPLHLFLAATSTKSNVAQVWVAVGWLQNSEWARWAVEVMIGPSYNQFLCNISSFY